MTKTKDKERIFKAPGEKETITYRLGSPKAIQQIFQQESCRSEDSDMYIQVLKEKSL